MAKVALAKRIDELSLTRLRKDGRTECRAQPLISICSEGYHMRIAAVSSWSLVAYLMLAGSPFLRAQLRANNNKVDIPAYQIAQVPQQLFYRGEAVRLRVNDVMGSRFSVNAVPTPTNKPSIDPSTGVLVFVPAPSDAGNFTLMIASKHPDGTSATKQVIVSVFTNLAPEYTLVSQARKPPADDDKQYITVTETEDPVHRVFNNQPERKLVNVVISGKTVIFDTSNDLNGLMTRLDGRQDLESVSIFAETLIFRSPLRLPETNVKIVARRLRFEDVPGQASAAIITTPNSLTTNPGLGKNGANGLKAGSVTLAVQSFSALPGDSPRFDLTGGNGQEAGLGKAGDPGADMPCYHNVVLADGTCIVHIHQFAGPTSFGPDNMWPGNGGDATPPGAPGAAGSGGDFTSNLAGLSSTIRNSPGQAGNVAKHVDGGPPGHPEHALSIEIVGNHNRIGSGGSCPPPQFGIPCSIPTFFPRASRIESTHDSHGGRGADPPSAPVVADSPGKLLVTGAADAWLHPIMLRAVLNHAEDAYLNGDLDYTQSVLDDYAVVVDARLDAWDANAAQRDQTDKALLAQASEADKPAIQAQIDGANADHDSLVQLRLEMENISLKLRSNLDYFGHPAGWVPQLSFAASLRSYADEVKKDIPILYLAYYVQESSADRQRHIISLQQSVLQLQSDVKQASDDFNTAQAVIPGLEEQAAGVQNEINLFEQQVANRKNELMAKAEQNVADRNNVPFWKQALGVLSAVATVCPVGQPVLGSVGAGLGILAKASDQGAVETAEQLGSLAGDFTQEKIKQSVDKYHAQIALIDPSKAKDAQTYVKGLVPFAEGLAKEYQAVSDSLQTRKASSDEVQKEAAQLEADDSNLADLAQKLSSSNADQQKFDEHLAEAMNKASSSSSAIMSDWSSIDAANRAMSSETGAADHEAVQEIAEFGRRARDRLLLFQYYVAKAYEYRFLQPYPGELNINQLLYDLVALTSQSHDQGFHPLSEAQFNNLSHVYDESVQEVVHEAVNYLQTHPKAHLASFPYELSPAERATLNRDGTVELNLGQEIGHVVGEENRRLISITVEEASAAPPDDNSQPQAIRISFEHNGTTTLHSDEQSYRFDHRRDPRDQPFRWAGTLDGTSWAQDQIAPEYIGLLKQLLNLPEDSANYDELFAYPGLESVISVTRQLGDAQALTRLKLKINYEYDQPAEDEYPIDVVALDGLEPLINVDARDNSGRTLGQGCFTRYYPKGASVTLTAPALFGTHRFVAWHIAGSGIVNSPNLTVTMSRALRAQVEYTR